jgi:hypothetical protein
MAVVACLLFSLFCTFAVAVEYPAAGESDPGNLIETFLNSDGAYTEAAISELERSFFSDPYSVLQAVAELDAETANVIVCQLSAYIAGGGSDNILAFEDIIIELFNSVLSEDEFAITESLKAEVCEYYSSSQVVSNDFVPGDIFDVDTIRSFIETSSASDFAIDEELDVLLAKCYYLDPNLFVDTIMGLNNYEISKVAGKIASGKSEALNIIQSEELSPNTFRGMLEKGY